MNNSRAYNNNYYARNRERITEQRRALRLAMTEQERERARTLQRQRTKKHAAKRRAELEELVTLANTLLDHTTTVERKSKQYGL